MDSLKVLTGYPDAMLGCHAREVHDILGGPSLFFLEGRRAPPLFITCLQHGNEPSGFEAVQMILRKYRAGTLPRSVWLFVANTRAAAEGKRLVVGQQDYNRCWPGTMVPDGKEIQLLQEVVDTVCRTPIFASVDLHNNTGQNPHYGCVNRLDHSFLQLATLFSRTVVYFTQPCGVQSLAMSEYTPSVTLECGKVGDRVALDHAVTFLDACLHLHHIPDQKVQAQDIHLLQTKATVKVVAGTTFGFGGTANQVNFRQDIDLHNFGSIPAGSVIAKIKPGVPMPLCVTNNHGTQITEDFFRIEGGALKANRSFIPSMASTDVDVVRQDCLFYVMEELALPS